MDRVFEILSTDRFKKLGHLCTTYSSAEYEFFGRIFFFSKNVPYIFTKLVSFQFPVYVVSFSIKFFSKYYNAFSEYIFFQDRSV